MVILYDNDAFDDATLTPSSQLGNFAATEMQKIQSTSVWRTTDIVDEEVVIDSNSAVTIEGVALINHNITAAATITFEGNSVNDFTSPPFSTTLTHRPDLILDFFTAETYRFWRVRVEDATNPDGFIEIGRIFLSPRFDVDHDGHSSELEFPERHVRNDRQSFALSGEVFTDIGISRKDYQYRFRWTDQALKAAFETMNDEVGKHFPFVFANYSDDTYWDLIPPIYAVLTNDLTFQWHGFRRWSTQLNVREVT